MGREGNEMTKLPENIPWCARQAKSPAEQQCTRNVLGMGCFWFISSAKSPEEQKNHSFVREVKLALKEGRVQLQFF
jgi:hypothetical protein